ncbi:hypothetical protein [uncultured Erythrobacter sp.]|uniref:hypothetical protein n=1 Tax=uncultured Erythrobacter sp. TaxID=263913 RepID=UPI0026068706|nr:hypothetical protein [uncultured Erythrobacter sp.]
MISTENTLTPASLGALTTTRRHDGWTTDRQSTFLRALASSHSVAQAARAAGMSRQSAYALRARLKGEPFDLAWGAALRCRLDALAEAAMERALNGVEVPHFYKGELVHTSRKFDERLTVALLLMRDRFAPPYMGETHPGFAYRDGEFGRLLTRVETGPETWAEEMRLEREALYEEYADDEDCHDDDFDDEDFGEEAEG